MQLKAVDCAVTCITGNCQALRLNVSRLNVTRKLLRL